MVTRQVVHGHTGDAALLPRGNGCRGAAEVVAQPRFHFDENNRVAIFGNDVDFAEPGAIPAFNNCVPAPLQLRARECFSSNSQCLTLVHEASQAGSMPRCSSGPRPEFATRCPPAAS